MTRLRTLGPPFDDDRRRGDLLPGHVRLQLDWIQCTAVAQVHRMRLGRAAIWNDELGATAVRQRHWHERAPQRAVRRRDLTGIRVGDARLLLQSLRWNGFPHPGTTAP